MITVFSETEFKSLITADISCSSKLLVIPPDITSTLFPFAFNKELNLVSILENNNLTDDNFHLYPIKYYYSFYNIINKELPMNINNILIFHSLLDKFRERFEINYLCNENTCVPNLSFFIDKSLKLRFSLNPVPIDFENASLAANLFE